MTPRLFVSADSELGTLYIGPEWSNRLTKNEILVYGLLAEIAEGQMDDGLRFETLARHLGISQGRFASALLGLQEKKLVRGLPMG